MNIATNMGDEIIRIILSKAIHRKKKLKLNLEISGKYLIN